MFKIIKTERLNPQVKRIEVEAPLIAKKAQPGQFIMLRVDHKGERIPLTINDINQQTGTITIVVQMIGRTTKMLGALEDSEYISDVVGPLGIPTQLEGYKKVIVIGGGLATAIAYPQAKKLKSLNAEIYSIIGARSKELIILEKEMKQVSDKLYIATDDGTAGTKGFVTDILKNILQEDEFDLVIAIGPLIMMKMVCEITKQYRLKTIVSMNPIMIDGTGMCGGCRVTVGGKTRFACVDGPDFDGYEVDFDEAIRRQSMYKEQEKISDHMCKLKQ